MKTNDELLKEATAEREELLQQGYKYHLRYLIDQVENAKAEVQRRSLLLAHATFESWLAQSNAPTHTGFSGQQACSPPQPMRGY